MAVVGFLAVSMPASAQWWATPTVYCTIGSTSCMGAFFNFTQVEPTPNSLGGTLFSAFLQNLQGSLPTTTLFSSLGLFQLHRNNKPPGVGDAGFVSLSGPARATPVGRVDIGHFAWEGTIPLFRESYVPPFHNAPVVHSAEYHWNGLPSIMGCNAFYQDTDTPVRFKSFMYRTCPREGLNGWLRLDFLVNTWNYAAFDFRNVPMTLNDFAFTVYDVYTPHWDSCTFGNYGAGMPARGTNCNVYEYHLPTVTPEPSTLLLLGGTLPLALGFVRARRKRR
jgi:hypothetical protein